MSYTAATYFPGCRSVCCGNGTVATGEGSGAWSLVAAGWGSGTWSVVTLTRVKSSSSDRRYIFTSFSPAGTNLWCLRVPTTALNWTNGCVDTIYVVLLPLMKQSKTECLQYGKMPMRKVGEAPESVLFLGPGGLHEQRVSLLSHQFHHMGFSHGMLQKSSILLWFQNQPHGSTGSWNFCSSCIDCWQDRKSVV